MAHKSTKRKGVGPPDFCDYGVGVLAERLDKMLAHTEGAAGGRETRPFIRCASGPGVRAPRWMCSAHALRRQDCRRLRPHRSGSKNRNARIGRGPRPGRDAGNPAKSHGKPARQNSAAAWKVFWTICGRSAPTGSRPSQRRSSIWKTAISSGVAPSGRQAGIHKAHDAMRHCRTPDAASADPRIATLGTVVRTAGAIRRNATGSRQQSSEGQQPEWRKTK